MQTIFILLLCFLGVGLFARAYNARTRLLLATLIIAMILFMALT
jgi:hypothetical protein